MLVFFFFKQKTAYEMRISDWSSDVCSSDLMTAEMLEQDLAAYENKDQREGVLEVGKPRHHRGEREIECAQPEHGEDVRRVDEIGLLRDGQDRRHALQREQRVGAFDQD